MSEYVVYQCQKCKSHVPIDIHEHKEPSHGGITYKMPYDMGELIACADCHMVKIAQMDRWYDTEYEYPMHPSVRPITIPTHHFSGKRLQNWSWSVRPNYKVEKESRERK